MGPPEMILISDLDLWQELDCGSKVARLISGTVLRISSAASPGFRAQPTRGRALARLKYAALRDDAFVFSASSKCFFAVHPFG
jgi:hypothetical protein